MRNSNENLDSHQNSEQKRLLSTEMNSVNNCCPESQFFTSRFKEVCITSFPIILANFFDLAYLFIRTELIARNSSTALAVVDLTDSTSSLSLAPSVLLSPLFVLISQEIAHDRHNEAGLILQQNWLLSILLSLVSIPCLLLSSYFLYLVGVSKELISLVKMYSNIYFLAIPAFMINRANKLFLISTKRQKALAIWSFFINIFATVLLTLLLYNKISNEHIVQLLATSQIVKEWGFCIAFFFYLKFYIGFSNYNIFRFRIRDGLSFLRKQVKLGLPLVFYAYALKSSGYITSTFIGIIGSRSLEIDQVSIRLLNWIDPLIEGLRSASGVFISRSLSVNEMKRYAKVSYCLAAIIGLIPWIVFVIFPVMLANIFLKDIQSSEEKLIRLVFFLVGSQGFFSAIRETLTVNLEGASDTFIPSVISASSVLILIIPITYLLGIVGNFELIGINLGYTIGLAIDAGALFARWHYRTRSIARNNESLENIEEGSRGAAVSQSSFLKNFHGFFSFRRASAPQVNFDSESSTSEHGSHYTL